MRDGDAVALEGFTHLIPFAAGHELVRQKRQDLTLIRMTPDIIYDQMIGMGCASRVVFSWGGNPGVGSLHRFRDAIENGWPAPVEIEEHSHADMAASYQAGASGLPFAVMRGYVGSDLPKFNKRIQPITCPFTGEVFDGDTCAESGRDDHSRSEGGPQGKCRGFRNRWDSEGSGASSKKSDRHRGRNC